jgi:hypothetical protein
MTSNGSDRSGLLTAGGVLSIVVGAFQVIGGGILVALVGLGIPLRLWFLQWLPRLGGAGGMAGIPIWLIAVGGFLVVLGVIAIGGGISAIRRNSFGLSLAGAICAFIPLNLFGLLAVIFVSLGKREFSTED